MLERLSIYEHSMVQWRSLVSSLNLRDKLEWQGNDKHKTAFCYLDQISEPQHALSTACSASKGVGKGLTDHQIELSARYEALENYLASNHLFPRGHKLTTIDNLLSYSEAKLIPFRFEEEFLTEEKDQILPFIITNEFSSLKPYAIPLATLDVNYYKNRFPEDKVDYWKYRCYASTNGLTCGANFKEALIHGLSEIVERDAVSYFLMDTFIFNDTLKIINKLTLPKYLQTLIHELEEENKDEILLIHVPSRYNVPTFCAVFTRQKTKIPPKGFGTSLNADYAAERAILEALQTLHVYERFPKECTDIETSKLQDYPALLECLKFDLIEKYRSKNYETVEFKSTPYNLNTLSLGEYVMCLIEKVYKKSPLLLIDKILSLENGFSCLNVIVPGAEEFFHVFNDEAIIPQPHTRDYIEKRILT